MKPLRTPHALLFVPWLAMASLGCGDDEASSSSDSSGTGTPGGSGTPGGTGDPAGTGATGNGGGPSGSSTGSSSGAATGSGGSGAAAGIAAAYPGDVGLDAHPSVVFFEDFEDADVSTMIRSWDSADEGPLSLEADVPAAAAPGSKSLRISVAGADGVTLYKNVPDQQGDVFVRYYVNYTTDSYHHAGMWLGGYNPPTQWPQGTAGIHPNGSDFFHNAWEPHSTGSELQMDHYAQWAGMDCFMDPGGCWGNVFLDQAEPLLQTGSWICVELMYRMNTPGLSDGQYAVWMDDVLVQHLMPGSPSFERLGNGVWRPDPNGTPFPGFDWRSTPELAFNFIWLDFYVDSGPSSMRWDQVVVATERIGCMTPAE